MTRELCLPFAVRFDDTLGIVEAERLIIATTCRACQQPLTPYEVLVNGHLVISGHCNTPNCVSQITTASSLN